MKASSKYGKNNNGPDITTRASYYIYLKERDKEKTQRAEEKRQYDKSPKGEMEITCRKICRSADQVQTEAVNRISNQYARVSDDIYNLILNTLNLPHTKMGRVSGYNYSVKTEDIIMVMSTLLPVLKRLDSAEDNEFLKEATSHKLLVKNLDLDYSKYDHLINRLIDVDIRFARFARQITLQYKNLSKKLDKAPREIQFSILKYKERVEANPNKDYISTARVNSNLNSSLRDVANAMIEQLDAVEKENAMFVIDTTKTLREEIYALFKRVHKSELIDNLKATEYLFMPVTKIQQITEFLFSLDKTSEDEYSKLINQISGLDPRIDAQIESIMQQANGDFASCKKATENAEV